jgi:uncharacterized protein (DUF2236 family)
VDDALEPGAVEPGDSPDPGYFGPGSITWRVHGDLGMFPAGLTALMLQALHPRALAGVLRGSAFREDPQGRLARTAQWVGLSTYGPRPEVDRLAAKIRRIHRRLGVDEPDLLLWVHVTGAVAFVTGTRACGLALTDAEVDRYYDEQVRTATLMGIDAAVVPRSQAEVAAYLRAVRPELRAGPAARDVLRFLTVPPMAGWVRYGTPAGAAWAGLAGVGFGLLPGWARRMYGGPLAALPGSGLSAAVAGRALRATAGVTLPARFREGPQKVSARTRLGLT